MSGTLTLGQVQGLQVGAPLMEIPLSWTALTNATTYHVQYKPHGTTTWLNGPVVNAPQVRVTVHSLTPGLTYDFRVYGAA